MKRSKFDLDRRTLLKATGVSIALPLLEAMLPSMLRAQTASKPILINWVWPNGLPLHYDQATYGPNRKTYVPQWMLDHFKQGLSAKLKASSAIVGNSNHNWADKLGHGHFANSIGVYMGSNGKYKSLDHLYTAPGNGEDLMEETYDQRIARHFGIKPEETINIAMTKASRGERAINSLSWFKSGDRHQSVFLDTLPAKLFDRITGGTNNTSSDKETRRKILLEKNSLLSLILDQTKALNARLGVEDRARVDEYLTGISEAEKKVVSEYAALEDDGTPKVCQGSLSRPKDYKYAESIQSSSEYLEKIRIYMDLMTLSMECGQHSIFGVIGGGAGNYGFSLNGKAWHPASHYIADTVYNSPEHNAGRKIFGDFAKMQVDLFKEWMEKLALKNQPDGSVLFDRVFATCTSYLGEAGHHTKGIPLFMLGTGGGRIPLHNSHTFTSDINGIPKANIWLSVLKQMGISDSQFGLSSGTLTDFNKPHGS